jgi:hypothetical protein
MFHKKPYFTEKELEQLAQIREIYIAATKDRSAAPADFDLNIAYLKQLRTATHLWLNVIQPYMEKKLAKKVDEKKHSLKFDINFSESKATKEAKKIIFTPEVVNLCKLAFEREPRIDTVRCEETRHYDEKENYGNITDVSYKTTIDFLIKFSDGFVLTLHSLEDEKELAQARDVFERKMQELSSEQMLAFR